MRFFTSSVYRSWYRHGHLEQIEASHHAYQAHLAKLSESLRLRGIVDMARLSGTDDALIVKVDHDREAKQLTLILRAGDLQMGYYDLILHYGGASIIPSHDRILADIAMASHRDLWRHEVEEIGQHIVHRFMFHMNTGNADSCWFEIKCDCLKWERKPRPHRKRPVASRRYPNALEPNPNV